MRKIIPLIAFALLAKTTLFAQKAPVKQKPFIVQGRLKNFHAQQLFIFYSSDNNNLSDTTTVSPDGTFKIVSYKVTKPGTAYLKKNDQFYTDLYVAPGYNLTIAADCGNGKLPIKHKNISGYGSVPNQYIFIRDSIAANSTNHNRSDYYKMYGKELMQYESVVKRRNDSVKNVVFRYKKSPDEYYSFFNKRIAYDNFFGRLDRISYQAAMDTSMNYDQMIAFVKAGIDKTEFNQLIARTSNTKPAKSAYMKDAGNISLNLNPDNEMSASGFTWINNSDFLISGAYKTFMIDGYYVFLHELFAKKYPSENIDPKKYNVDAAKIVSGTYKGEIKDRALYKLLHDAELYCRSFEEINIYKTEFPKYIAQLTSKVQQDELDKLLIRKVTELSNTQAGKSAPDFTAIDSAGTTFRFSDIRGKVIVLDLWASWCGPCREMTPYMKTLSGKYSKGDIAFISVAVDDKIENWKKAVIEDKPSGVQLFDATGLVQKSFVANSYPKVVVINKKGKIVTLDAPLSHSLNDLKVLLDKEIAE